jgi:ABC-type branched-subunit amino acid transport system permease subunit
MFSLTAATAGMVAVVTQILQNNDHTSVWLAFTFAWIACALAALASSSLVFRVAEVRKRVTRSRR